MATTADGRGVEDKDQLHDGERERESESEREGERERERA
jgi:hypothetical protein